MEHSNAAVYDAAHALGLLSDFGLTRQEASVYLELLQCGELNGYEVAKALNISRSNAYTALAGLVDHGAAWILEGPTTRYTAVPAQEFLAARLLRLQDARDRLLSILPTRRAAIGGYITIKGADNIRTRLTKLLTEVHQRVYLALPADLLETCIPALKRCLKEGRKVVIITDAAVNRSQLLREGLAKATLHIGRIEADSLRVIVDSNYVLTGDLAGGKLATCLYSDHKNLVDLFKVALRNEIRLIELGVQVSED